LLASGVKLARQPLVEPLQIDAIRATSPGNARNFAKRFTTDAVITSDLVTASVNGQPPAPPTPIPIEIGLREPVVKDVFARFAAEPTWVNLANVVELIEQDVGGEAEIVRRGWARKAELGLFQHTANNMHAAGLGARHADRSRRPPARPMSIEDARGLVLGLVERWLETK
jgi:hypothetical protein